MSYALLDDCFPDHPKVAPLSDAGFRAHVRAICWCKHHRTGGVIRRGTELVICLKRARAIVDELVRAHLWDEHPDGWQIHDWSDWFNEDETRCAESKAIEDARRRELSEKRAAAGRRGGLRSAEQPRDGGRFAPRDDAEQVRANGPEQTPSNDRANAEQTEPSKPSNHRAPSRARPSDPDPDRSDHDPSDREAQAGAKGSKPARKWRRVPEDWTPSLEHARVAREMGVDIALEAAKFRDHEFARPHSDVDAAFRNWLRRAGEPGFGPASRTAKPPPQRSYTDPFEGAEVIGAKAPA